MLQNIRSRWLPISQVTGLQIAPIGRLGVREVLCLGGRFRFGGVCAGVCDPVVDECKEPVEAAGGQLAERDFWPQAGQVRFTVEPRDAEGVQSRGQPAAVLLAVIRNAKGFRRLTGCG